MCGHCSSSLLQPQARKQELLENKYCNTAFTLLPELTSAPSCVHILTRCPVVNCYVVFILVGMLKNWSFLRASDLCIVARSRCDQGLFIPCKACCVSSQLRTDVANLGAHQRVVGWGRGYATYIRQNDPHHGADHFQVGIMEEKIFKNFLLRPENFKELLVATG